MTLKENAVVFDIDGTLLDTEYIFREILNLKLKGDAKWDYFMKHCNSEKTKPFDNILELWFCLSTRYEVFISTARNEKCKETTLAKLQKSYFFIKEESIFMRKDGDYRAAVEVKKDHLNEILKNYNIIAFIDDDHFVQTGVAGVKLAKELGIPALRKV